MALPAFSDDQAIPAHEVHRLTVEDYLRLVEPGDPTWEHTELIDGVVYDVTPRHDRHAAAVMALVRLLLPAFPDDEVRVGSTVRLGDRTVVEPDVHVFVKGPDYDDLRPIEASSLKLAAEVSVNTMRRDRGIKATAYGAAGVPVYWVVDPTPGAPVLLVHTDPFAGGYNRIRRIELPDGVDHLDVADALTA